MKINFIGILIFIFTSFSSQSLSVTYEAKYKSNSKIQNYDSSSKMVLDIVGKESIFREQIDRNGDSLQFSNKTGLNSIGIEYQFYVKKNFENNITEKIITNSTIHYLLPIDEELNWKILPERKNIGKFNAQKAETTYGGRNWVAWFTTEIPFSDGPYIFRNLPGLILSIEDTNTNYAFNFIQIKKGSNLFNTRTKTIKIDWEKYDMLAKSHYNDPLDLNSKIGKTVIFTDAKGNNVEIDIIKKQRQKSILENDNPIELNHKIKY